MQVYGMESVIRIVCHLLFIYIAFWSLGALRIEQLFKSQHVQQAKIFLCLIAIVIGYTVSYFLLELMALFRNLFFMFFS